jgi:hypothetical protein
LRSTIAAHTSQGDLDSLKKLGLFKNTPVNTFIDAAYSGMLANAITLNKQKMLGSTNRFEKLTFEYMDTVDYNSSGIHSRSIFYFGWQPFGGRTRSQA